MKGTCKHGEFELIEGCAQCIAEAIGNNKPTKQIVKVRYFSETTGELSGREYTYFSEVPLKVGDVVTVPVRDTIGKAQISAINVPEETIQAFKDKVKVIPAGSVVTEGNQATGHAPPSVGSTTAPVIPFVLADESVPSIPGTALIKIEPSQDESVKALLNEVMGIQRYADARSIQNTEDVKSATNDLTIIQQLKKRIMEKQKEYLDPLKQHVADVTNAFKMLLDPLATADKVTRDKILEYRETIRKLEEARRQTEELQAKLEKREPEAVVTVEQPEHYRAELGTAGTVKNWKWEIEDFSKLSDMYKMPDATKIGKVIRAGGSIPGVRAWQEESLRITKGE